MPEDIFFKRMRRTWGVGVHEVGKHQNAFCFRGKIAKLSCLCLDVATTLTPVDSTLFMATMSKYLVGNGFFKVAF